MLNQETQSFNNLPSAIIKIPITQPVAALLLHLCNHRIGAVNISLEDLRVDGAQLVISSIVNSDTNKDKNIFAIYENDEFKHLKKLVNRLIEEKFAEDDEEYIRYYSDFDEDDLENQELEEEILRELETDEKDWGKHWGDKWGVNKILDF